jgi:hypothetical protein
MSIYESVHHSSARAADAFVLALILSVFGILAVDVYAAAHVL